MSDFPCFGTMFCAPSSVSLMHGIAEGHPACVAGALIKMSAEEEERKKKSERKADENY